MKKSLEKRRPLILVMSELVSGISVFKQHLMHPYCRHTPFILLMIITQTSL
jgi:hypothetical protein